MNSVKIPQGDTLVKVELTVRELMALTGVRFHENHKVEVEARKKLNEVLEDTYHIEKEAPQLLN
ncbi:hypothetical protein BG53_11290 [Paenibacillus darwinianus]|uniref:Uncharacterized protein n=1 Tax=Paenibacillus darwinianus TaxID=1380763 RepID=A0A9W5W813_9BACL|nr:hypothetical protein [Paenibacillus darwinianus]EXX90775.1 hypothetical protein BG52_12175 [Paenibacillus darwinianus]EXX91410.1 hypothetical protein BG53_11290 [Paenibacillus darwinianus]EXX92178.1 hypothetical protein CH50_11865 [Paenibacillus darwinianus]